MRKRGSKNHHVRTWEVEDSSGVDACTVLKLVNKPVEQEIGVEEEQRGGSLMQWRRVVNVREEDAEERVGWSRMICC